MGMGQIMNGLVSQWLSNKRDGHLLMHVALDGQDSHSEARKNFLHGKSQLLSAFSWSTGLTLLGTEYLPRASAGGVSPVMRNESTYRTH